MLGFDSESDGVEFGENYADIEDQNSVFNFLTKDLNADLSYIDKKGIITTVLEVNATCCRPLKIKCTNQEKYIEDCSAEKGI